MIKIVVVAFLLVLMSSSAKADWTYTMVGYQCDIAKQAIVITNDEASDAAGQAMEQNAGPNHWDPWKWVTTDDNGLVNHTSEVVKTCNLGQHSYKIVLKPVLFSGNVVGGMCGSAINASVDVLEAGKDVYSTNLDYLGVTTCQAAGARTIKQLVFQGIGKIKVIYAAQ